MPNLHRSNWVVGVLVVACSAGPDPLEGSTKGADETSSAEGSGGGPASTATSTTSATATAGVTSGAGGSASASTTSSAPPPGDDGTPPGDGDGDGDGDGGEEVAPCPEAAATTLEVGDNSRTLMVDGFERSYLIHLPPAHDGTTRLPLVLDFHGLGGTGAQQRGFSGWRNLGDEEGFVTVFPQGVDNAWDAGSCCGDGEADDVAFVRALVADLTSVACIDERRIFASGCSNGGGMSYKLACDAADLVAGIAPVDFDCVDGFSCGDCAPSRQVSVVQFRGTEDDLVPYEGNGGFFAGAQQNFAIWGDLNACTDGVEAVMPDGCEAFTTCGEGSQTLLCTVQGGTHCGSYGSFNIAEVAWGVLQNVSLP